MTDRLNKLIVNVFARLQREEGQGTAEYAIVLTAVVVVAALIATVVSPTIKTGISNVATSIGSAFTG
jgi:Flp pilus assembly pilin Flp